MICRLHGLPHELKRPGGDPVQGPGCNFGKFDPNGYIPFDRTLFYQEMAAIELRFRKTLNLSGRVKQTIAQMLISS
jgi:hypothetical protein